MDNSSIVFFLESLGKVAEEIDILVVSCALASLILLNFSFRAELLDRALFKMSLAV